MKIFKMIRGLFPKRSRSYEITQNVIFHVKLLSPTLTRQEENGFRKEFPGISEGCCDWIDWLSHERNIKIQSALHGGEKKIVFYYMHFHIWISDGIQTDSLGNPRKCDGLMHKVNVLIYVIVVHLFNSSNRRCHIQIIIP